jgi:hypothetical protein
MWNWSFIREERLRDEVQPRLMYPYETNNPAGPVPVVNRFGN